MNGWTLTKVYRINGKLVVADGMEDAIKVYRDWCSPTPVTIEKAGLVFGDSANMDCDAVIADSDRKAEETIAILTEENEKLKEQLKLKQ